MGSEMCIRDRPPRVYSMNLSRPAHPPKPPSLTPGSKEPTPLGMAAPRVVASLHGITQPRRCQAARQAKRARVLIKHNRSGESGRRDEAGRPSSLRSLSSIWIDCILRR